MIQMERSETSGYSYRGGLNTLVCDDELHDEEFPSQPYNNQNIKKVSSMIPGRRCSVPTVSLVLLAVVLFIVDISLGVYYNKLRDTHLTTEDIEHIEEKMHKLKDTYKTAIDTIKDTKNQLDSEMSRQTQTKWELEHQAKRKDDYKVKIDKITKDITSLRAHLPMLDGGCKHCPPGWILMNFMCYYFSLSAIDGTKTWRNAREFCQLYGGDLLIIDSKDKENSTVSILLNNYDPSKPMPGFWIGLTALQERGTWKWVNGKFLVEGYWRDGEPNDTNDEDCAAVYPRQNFFKAWSDNGCLNTKKWICEKTPSTN